MCFLVAKTLLFLGESTLTWPNSFDTLQTCWCLVGLVLCLLSFVSPLLLFFLEERGSSHEWPSFYLIWAIVSKNPFSFFVTSWVGQKWRKLYFLLFHHETCCHTHMMNKTIFFPSSFFWITFRSIEQQQRANFFQLLPTSFVCSWWFNEGLAFVLCDRIKYPQLHWPSTWGIDLSQQCPPFFYSFFEHSNPFKPRTLNPFDPSLLTKSFFMWFLKLLKTAC